MHAASEKDPSEPPPSFGDPREPVGIPGARRPAALLDDGPQWYACRTRPRAEKRADQLLTMAGVQSYLPLIYRERQWADRRVRVAFPLFPGYLFAHFDLIQLAAVLRIPPLARVVSVNGRPAPVQERELDQVRALVDRCNENGIEPCPIEFVEPGQEVVVAAGPFRGLRGVLVERRGRMRVAVRLEAIRQAVSIEMDRRVLKPAVRAVPPGPFRPGRKRGSSMSRSELHR